ncbi:MAG TPA: SbcC/MukB-like Walker B domain-containing protein, partial [Candidatus Thermoplasmatota archaeon]|nr:SbcC/MukB-like Walker B domain-containing protein [Candidatus Thermoplasmatota archaeon]
DEAAARAARLREHEAALGAEPFDPEKLAEARKRLAALEALRETRARLLAVAERLDEAQARLEDLAKAVAEAAALRERAEADRAALAFDPAAHEALERAAQEAEGRLHEARLARERALGEAARREDDARRAREEAARQRALAEEAKTLEERARLLEHLAGDNGLLLEFKEHLMGRVRPLLSLHAGRLFRELTEGRYADLEVDESYDLRVHDDGEAFALERFSGGESDLANLCLRLAVSRVVADRAGGDGLGFLALDEVFGSQDEVRKGNILRALSTLSARFRQILLITHVPDVKDAVEHVLRVEAMEDGTSRVVQEC